MDTTYEVKIWSIRVYKGAKGSTYTVRWKTGDSVWPKTFTHRTQADSFRSGLVSAARKGEAFRLSDGLPVSMGRSSADMLWYAFACSYVDMKWKSAAATYRRSIAEALVTATISMLKSDRGRPDDKVLRSALFRWAFNTQRREDPEQPQQIADALRWVERNTKPVAALADAQVLRPVLDAVARKLDGRSASATVVNRKRAVLSNAMEYAVELEQLAVNPIPALKWKAPKVTHAVDRRSVVNPIQARTLLNAVDEVRWSGRRLKACYACSYYSGLRPEEAVNLREGNIVLKPLVWNGDKQSWERPEDDWGEFLLEKAAPHAGKEWTDSGRQRDDRGLKHRPVDEVRSVPIPPPLAGILRDHLAEFGTGPGDRLFRGERGDEVPVITYLRVWHKARARAFTPEVVAGPLAKVPYDLRHAALSTWLNGGVPATQVAEWAGNSVEVLLKVYAKVQDNMVREAQARMAAALG
jgi:integrase